MTNLRTFALAAAFLGSISLPALAQGTNVTPAPVAKPVAAQTQAKGTTVHAPVHRIASTTEAAKPTTDSKAPAIKGATAKPAAGTTTTGAAPAATPAAKPVIKTN